MKNQKKKQIHWADWDDDESMAFLCSPQKAGSDSEDDDDDSAPKFVYARGGEHDEVSGGSQKKQLQWADWNDDESVASLCSGQDDESDSEDDDEDCAINRVSARGDEHDELSRESHTEEENVSSLIAGEQINMSDSLDFEDYVSDLHPNVPECMCKLPTSEPEDISSGVLKGPEEGEKSMYHRYHHHESFNELLALMGYAEREEQKQKLTRQRCMGHGDMANERIPRWIHCYQRVWNAANAVIMAIHHLADARKVSMFKCDDRGRRYVFYSHWHLREFKREERQREAEYEACCQCYYNAYDAFLAEIVASNFVFYKVFEFLEPERMVLPRSQELFRCIGKGRILDPERDRDFLKVQNLC